MHSVTAASRRHAPLRSGWRRLMDGTHYPDEKQCDWTDPLMLLGEPPSPRRSPGSGTALWPAWSGCPEIIDCQLRVSRYLSPLDRYDGAVLFLETSEEMPSAADGDDVLMGMGARGLRERFAAVLVGRPKASSTENPGMPKRSAKTPVPGGTRFFAPSRSTIRPPSRSLTSTSVTPIRKRSSRIAGGSRRSRRAARRRARLAPYTP